MSTHVRSSIFLTLDFLRTKWRQRQLSNVITPPHRHSCDCNALQSRNEFPYNVFANESIGEMISHGRNALQCNVMHANQGPV